MAVRETLELNIAPAEAAVQQLAGNLEAALRNAISSALGGSYVAEVRGDASNVEAAVSGAVQDADDEKQVQGDASGVTESIDDAVADGEDEKLVVGDASDVQAAIDGAVADADDEKVIVGEASEVTNAIDEAVFAANSQLDVGANTTQLEQDLAGLPSPPNDEYSNFNQTLAQGGVLGAAFGNRLGGSLAAAATPIGAATVAVGAFTAVGAIATKQYADFEYQLSEVRTLLPQLSDAEIRQLEDSVMAVSSELGITTSEAIPALYKALSAGIPPENVIDFLRTASTVAIGGITTLDTGVKGLTTIINAFGLEMGEASKVADVLFVGMKAGDTTVEQLANSMFQVAPIAAAVGLNFEEIVAGMSALTLSGAPTRQAANMLKRMVTELSDSTTQVGMHFEEVAGKSFPEFVASGGNLQEGLALLTQRADETGVSIDQLFSSSVAGQGALVLAGKQAEAFADTSTKAMEANGDAAEATAKVNDTLARRVQILQVRFGDLWLLIGRELAPALKQIVGLATELTSGFISLVQRGASVLNFLQQFGVFAEITRTLVRGLLETAIGMIPVIGPMVRALAGIGSATSGNAESSDAAAEATGMYKGALEDLIPELAGAEEGATGLAGATDAATQALDRFAANATASIPSVTAAFDELSAEKGTTQILAELDATLAGTQTWTEEMQRQIEGGNTNIVNLMAQLGPEKSRILLESYGGELADLEAHLERLAYAEMSARVAAREMAVRQYLEMQGVVGAAQDAIVDEVRSRLVLEDPTVDAIQQAAEAVNLDTSVPSSMAQAAGRSVRGWTDALDLETPTLAQATAIANLLNLTNLGQPSEAMALSAVERYNATLPQMEQFTSEQIATLVEIMTGAPLAPAGEEAGGNVASGFAGGAAPTAQAAGRAARDAEGAIRREAGTFFATGGRLADQFATGIRLRVNTVRGAGADTGRSARDGLRAAAPATEFFVVGGLAADGFARGIRARAQASANEAARMVREAAEAARREAETESPSRLFARIGDDIGAGLAQGMGRQSESVAEAARQMLAAADQAADVSFMTDGSTLREVSIQVPVTVTGNVSPEQGREFGEQVAGEVSRQLVSTLRLEGLRA